MSNIIEYYLNMLCAQMFKHQKWTRNNKNIVCIGYPQHIRCRFEPLSEFSHVWLCSTTCHYAYISHLWVVDFNTASNSFCWAHLSPQHTGNQRNTSFTSLFTNHVCLRPPFHSKRKATTVQICAAAQNRSYLSADGQHKSDPKDSSNISYLSRWHPLLTVLIEW